jgi:predicted AAA+ superfamily ATPase
MERELTALVKRDLGRKLVFVTGPRQAGKTWIARNLDIPTDYLNYDNDEHREVIRSRTWDRRAELIVFDELHKMPNWTQFLKGVYDVEGVSPAILVTGSARLDVRRKTGDSLAGRFFQYRLHPFDVRELADRVDPHTALTRILKTGGFPEPFLADDEEYYRRWRRSHLDVILRQDLLDVASVNDIRSIELLVDLLRTRVGSPISYASLAGDLQRDPKTVKRWLEILEDVYVVFAVRPWHRNVARAVLKEPKYYFFDTGQVRTGGAGGRSDAAPVPAGPVLENAVAGSLYKAVQTAEDRDGRPRALHYLRTRDGREIDFAVVREDEVTHLIEVKTRDTALSPSFSWFRARFPAARRVQLVYETDRVRTWPTGEELHAAGPFLAELSV